MQRRVSLHTISIRSAGVRFFQSSSGGSFIPARRTRAVISRFRIIYILACSRGLSIEAGIFDSLLDRLDFLSIDLYFPRSYFPKSFLFQEHQKGSTGSITNLDPLSVDG
jgi:hypothetical protein